MTDRAKRPWFRFHLLTAVLMMFLSGAFISANLTGRHQILSKETWNFPMGQTTYGWPFPAILTNDMSNIEDSHRSHYAEVLYREGVILNPLIGFFFLASSAALFEAIIRRCQDRKP